MTYFKSLVCVFILLSGVLFQICDVSGQWVNIKNHTVEAKNDSSMEAGGLGGIVGAAKEKVFGEIDVDAIYHINDEKGASKVQSMVFSSVSMLAVTVSFRGFASIRGTADAGHTKQFAGNQKKAVKTDKGVLNSAGVARTSNFTVRTSLVDTEDGRPISLSKSQFTDYKKWYAKASPKLQEKWGDSEGFSYKHSDNTFYTAMVVLILSSEIHLMCVRN